MFTRPEWTSECEDAWSKLKESLTNDTVMSYFDREFTTELVEDGSPHGLGGILTQVHHHDDDQSEVRIISYASSRALDEVESRYSEIEREALAVR